MANQFFVPFNNDPVSSTVKTSSYTVPSGKYARVSVSDTTADFTIDAVIVISATSRSGSAISTTTGVKFTNSSPYPLRGSVTGDGATAATVRIYPVGSNSSGAQKYELTTITTQDEVLLNVGDTIEVTAIGTGSTVYWNFDATTAPFQKEYWVPAGTVLNGAKFMVELFNSIS